MFIRENEMTNPFRSIHPRYNHQLGYIESMWFTEKHAHIQQYKGGDTHIFKHQHPCIFHTSDTQRIQHTWKSRDTIKKNIKNGHICLCLCIHIWDCDTTIIFVETTHVNFFSWLFSDHLRTHGVYKFTCKCTLITKTLVCEFVFIF